MEEHHGKTISLVLLPGLDGTGVLFQPLIGALPLNLRPIVVRYPCDRHCTYEELLDQVEGALPRSEPFIILGESFSGPVAVMAAARHPKNLIGVILCASFVSPPAPYIAPVVRVIARRVVFRLFPAMQAVKALLAGYAASELRGLLAEVHRLVGPKVMAARVRMVFETDVSDAFGLCEVPVLYIAGARDFVVPRRNLRRIQRLDPAVQSVVLDAPHMVLQTRPMEAAAVISTFASSCADLWSQGDS